MSATRKSDRKDIVRDDSDPYDRGYWARYDSLPRPVDESEAIGWNDCDAELKFEAKCHREARREALRPRRALSLARGDHPKES